MISCESEQLKELLKANESFRINFEKLLLAFQERMWTKDVCALFKALCEDLFRSYGITVIVTVREGLNAGKFEINFIETKEMVHSEKKTLDRSIFDVIKWFLRK